MRRSRSDREADDESSLSPLMAMQLESGWNCWPKRRLFLGEFAQDAIDKQSTKQSPRNRKS